MNILDIANDVAIKLEMDPNILTDIIKSRLDDEQLNTPINADRLEKITRLLNSDSEILNFEKKNIKSAKTKENFSKLKVNLGKLQILVLIKHLEK